MSEMVTRCAQAMYEANIAKSPQRLGVIPWRESDQHQQEHWCDLARAAIQALRDPSARD